MPMAMVREGEVVKFTISSHTGDVHPMHLHGHHALVLSRNGEAATGSPWWFDSLDVQKDETYEVAFVADNPGIWMDHCHNLKHARQGMVTHLMYEGVTTPYKIGSDSGNEPE
jgi:FtsP/CotA-like multicopper oxidase with cupredoxin domain